jgi:NAD(P)-dependent dehydrogenase (short-subunit alcohol dehydrogenase family)
MRLRDRVTLVIGGASGIGRAGAVAFAAEGAAVVVGDIDAAGAERTAAEIRAAGGQAAAATCDIANPADVEQTVHRALAAYGCIDVLFNTAAYLRDFKPVTETSLEEWRRGIDVTLTGTFLVCKAVLPHMVERRRGSIINTASVGGLVGFASYAAYCAAKGGVVMLTKSIAIDYGAHGIRCNALAPGAVDTPVLAEAKDNPDHRRLLLDMSVLGRWGQPEELASAAVFLASDDSSFVTGTTLLVDGGWTVR